MDHITGGVMALRMVVGAGAGAGAVLCLIVICR
uniref:Uncharacterized protein n=1 Tax=Rhizophora mucronata TaxID=61149 RepID=A0A2P2IYJ2_RHIMU